MHDPVTPYSDRSGLRLPGPDAINPSVGTASAHQDWMTVDWTTLNRTDIDIFKRRLYGHLKHTLARSSEDASAHDWYLALAHTTRDLLVETWTDSMRASVGADAKRVYYLSLEFLIGRSLENNLLAVGVMDICYAALAEMGLDFEQIRDQEPEAALGNGGLGRLAACFVDSLATLGIPGEGYGIHYHHGMFRQRIENGQQVEVPENWLTYGNPWEFRRPDVAYPVRFGGHVESVTDGEGHHSFRWCGAEEVLAIANDMPVPGYGGFAASSIRLWSARASQEFDLQDFNRGDYLGSVQQEMESESLSKVLYPDDSTPQGKILRFRQEYFFAAASVADILHRFRTQYGTDWAALPEKVAIQLNDTHPTIAIPELMRHLLDEQGLGWEDAWDICRGVFAYTNHTLLPEALETWPVTLFETVLPRHLQIIYEINRRFLEQVHDRAPEDTDLPRRVSLIDEDHGRRVRMAHLAVVGSHCVNGVAQIHTDLMKAGLFADFHRLFPDRIVNRTNGITPRRWLNQANRPLARLISRHVDEDWPVNLDLLRALTPLAEDAGFSEEFRAVKAANKARFTAFAGKRLGVWIDPASLFDVQVKRIHEYKRQLLNVLHVVSRYNRLRHGLTQNLVPRTVVFAGKAAPGYAAAKLIIRLIHAVAETVNTDPHTRDWLRVLFVPNYNVSSAEIIIPAADLSEQISTAGTEASGTGNMKLALNGALTIGTRDGANIEIAQEVGEDNLFFFGLSAAEVAAARQPGAYDPMAVMHANPELAEVLNMIRGGYFSPTDPDAFRPLIDALLYGGDHYMLLADYAAYCTCQDQVDRTYRTPAGWTRSAILTVARMGKFSADLTVLDYARDIWGVKATAPVTQDLGRYR